MCAERPAHHPYNRRIFLRGLHNLVRNRLHITGITACIRNEKTYLHTTQPRPTIFIELFLRHIRAL